VSRLTPARTLVLGGTAALAPAVERLTPCGGTPETSVLATGLDVPWDVAFTPDGRAFLTESDSGRILARNLDGTITEVQRLAVDPEGEGGLLGLAVSPTFADDGLLYAYLTTPEDNRIVRFRLGEAAEPILTGIPAGRIHNGGRIAFGPDGKLYAGTGEAGVPAHAQDPSSLGGKVLRLNADGSVPADNPLPGSPVYTLGHRNVQGLAWDAAGRLYITEFGPDRDDEINLLVPGGNYGWPEVTGTAGRPGFADPVAVRQPPEAAWSGATILQGGALPEYEGDLFAAGLRGQRLWRFALGPDGQVTGAEALFPGEFGRLRDVTQAPDGSLWILTDGDRLLRYGLQE
jgi:glucose/arabinose dehydrogenase